MGGVNVRYCTTASGAFFNTELLQLLLDELFLQCLPSRLEGILDINK
jgi:hypothetical protein